VRLDAVGDQLAQHAYLNGTETAIACQDKRGLHFGAVCHFVELFASPPLVNRLQACAPS
jgi:hypothetical protein